MKDEDHVTTEGSSYSYPYSYDRTALAEDIRTRPW